MKASDWPPNALPAHLRPRIEIVDHERKPLGVGRDLATLRQRLKQTKIQLSAASDSAEWTRVAQQRERFGLTDWTCGDLPECVPVSESQGLPVKAWPGLEFAEDGVNVRLFRSPDLARAASTAGVRRLVELAIQKDLAWLEKDLRALNRFDELYAPLGEGAELRGTALEHLKRHLLPSQSPPALTRAHFDDCVAESRRRLSGLAPQFMDRLGPILKLREEVRHRIGADPKDARPGPRTLFVAQPTGPNPRSSTGQSIGRRTGELGVDEFLDRIESRTIATFVPLSQGLAHPGRAFGFESG